MTLVFSKEKIISSTKLLMVLDVSGLSISDLIETYNVKIASKI